MGHRVPPGRDSAISPQEVAASSLELDLSPSLTGSHLTKESSSWGKDWASHVKLLLKESPPGSQNDKKKVGLSFLAPLIFGSNILIKKSFLISCFF